MLASLERDVYFKQLIGRKHVSDDLHYIEACIDKISNGLRPSGEVGLYKKYFGDEIAPPGTSYSQYEQLFNSQYESFTSILSKLHDLLDYSSYATFSEDRSMFKNYTGIISENLVADDPYYNYKNVTHPSY